MRTSYEVCVWYEILFHTVGQGELYSATPLCCSTDKMDKQTSVVGREEVETRKIGRNETWTFQGLFPRCTEVDEKPGKSTT